MRMLFDIEIPNDPFNAMVKDGSVGPKLQEILGEVRPEAIYFTDQDGRRGAVMVAEVPGASAIPGLCEPFFLAFNATVKPRIAMTPEDLGAAGLDELGRKYG